MSHPNTDLKTTITAILDASVTCLLITDGGANINCYTQTYHAEISPPKTKVIDTTAPRDAFIGGFLSRVALMANSKTQLAAAIKQQKNIHDAVSFAAKSGAYAVSKYGAFDSLPTNQDLFSLL